MRISSVILRNIGAAIALAAFLVLAQLIAPPSYMEQARLSCSATGPSMSFENMKACTSSADYRAGCACGPVSNPWSMTYHWGLVPFLAGLVGVATLRGTSTTRLAVLNATVLLVLLGQLIVAIQKHDSAVLVIPFAPIIAAVVCGAITGWFLLLRLSHRKLGERTHAT